MNLSCYLNKIITFTIKTLMTSLDNYVDNKYIYSYLIKEGEKGQGREIFLTKRSYDQYMTKGLGFR